MIVFFQPWVCVAFLICSVVVVEAQTEAKEGRKDGKGSRRRPGRVTNKVSSSSLPQNATTQKSSPDPIVAGVDGGSPTAIWDEDFEKSIEEMVLQVRNNSALSKNKINHDEKRIPVDIPEAKCSCAGCINPFTMQEDRTMTSVLIYTKIPVRRLLCDRPSRRHRKKKKCLPQYKTVVESIAVGCTCIV
ncbi:interleukin-17B-like isoform X4 [Scleropages formosus]|uniref:interleukin-17B-like isoform X4 n=1 Tax=Scleropages formosus TaxID=113540 RepID=UPI000878D0B6|nr:interleukin-17B isoform X4 [Scleropages formosus]